MKYDVFISCKREDYKKAEDISAFIRDIGLIPFLASESLRRKGNSAYLDEIDKALDESQHLIVFCTKPEYAESTFVKEEWQSFRNEKISGRKSGNILSIIDDNIKIGQLPYGLRRYEVIPFSNYETVLGHYLKHNVEDPNEETNIEDNTINEPTHYSAKYSAIDNKNLLELALKYDIEACKEIARRYYYGSNGLRKNIPLANNFLRKVNLPLFPDNEDINYEIENKDNNTHNGNNNIDKENDVDSSSPLDIDYSLLDNKNLLNYALNHDVEACKEIAYRYFSGTKGMTKNISLANNFLKKVDLPLYPTDNELPQFICFEFKLKKIIMVLSPNKQYYIGNIKADNDDFNWLDEKWIGVGGAAAIAAGAVFMGFVTIPIAIAVLLKSIGGFFSDSETENSRTNEDVIVDKEFILQLSNETKYKFDLPSESELDGIDKSVKNYCFVLRLKDNPNLMQ